MYRPVSSQANFSQNEREILEFWREHRIFQKSMEARRGAREYVFYDGPPFATGLPHYGHLLAGTIKDIVPRYQTMRGYFVDRRFGWDCHGLPVEYEAEQAMNISGKTQIEEIGVSVFNEKCRSIVLRYTKEWRETVNRMGRWVDFDREYKTMEPAYMESIWWVVKSLWEKKLIYEGQKILPYCPRCSTPLSNFETNQGYEEVTDPAITVRFKLTDEANAYVLAWTTTPWTLPSNMALAVGPKIHYVRIQDRDTVYYMARDRVSAYYRKPSEEVTVTDVPATHLRGRRYEPLFPYFADQAARGAFRIVEAEFVSTEEGTGIVHIAPGFGEDDNRLGQVENIPSVCPVDEEGRFVQPVSDYAGRSVKETDSDIMERLKKERKLVHRSTIVHSYPHCWRCETPLIYRAISTWFVRVEAIKDRMLAANRSVRWVPEHLRDGRFGKWLEGARDWAISRNRYWGAPLPIWKSADGKEVLCVGSIRELEELSGHRISDLHKHIVDDIEIVSPASGSRLRRIPEVLDCWFESGSMPYAQAHYPFENKQHFESHFPADFIAEGLDQTRGWFYTLMVLSTALFDRPAFRNVVVNGLVLAEDGRKLSKRLKNYPDPAFIIDTYGADALRLYLMNSPVVRAEDLRFSEEGVKHLVRHLMIPLWNAYSFFVTYANIDGWDSSRLAGTASPNVLDRWILSSLESLNIEVETAMESYDLQQAARQFARFTDDLTNWYIRRSRRRFWKSEDDTDKDHAYRTLCQVLLQVSKIAAPFIPFVTESMYRNLRTDEMPESVHLCDFPVPDRGRLDGELEMRMGQARTIVNLGRALRVEHNLKVRQPLASLHVICRDPVTLKAIDAFRDIVMDELNVKNVLADTHETSLVTLCAKADFKKLGPRLGGKVKAASSAIAELTSDQVEVLASGGTLEVEAAGETVVITGSDVVITRTPKSGMVVASEGSIVVALETAMTPDLVREGLAREFVNKVQNMRKNAGFEVSDRIRIRFTGDADVTDAIKLHGDYIRNETLGVECSPETSGLKMEEWDINGHPTSIGISRAE